MALIDITPVMTSNTTPSPYVASSSDANTTGQAAWNAFTNNGRLNTFWHSTAGSGHWIKIDFGSIIKIDAFSIMCNPTETSAPKIFILYGSNDNLSYEKIIECNNEMTWFDYEIRLYKLPHSVSFRYYRLNITADNGYNYTVINELKYWQDDGIVEYIDNKNYSMNYCLPQASTLEMKSRINDPREGLLGFSNDGNNYGTLWMINNKGQSEIVKSAMANATILFNGNATALGNYTLSGSIVDYKYILITAEMWDRTTNRNSIHQLIPVSELLAQLGQNDIIINMSAASTDYRTIGLNFSTSLSVFTISYLTNYQSSSVAVTKIYGIK